MSWQTNNGGGKQRNNHHVGERDILWELNYRQLLPPNQPDKEPPVIYGETKILITRW